MSTPAHQSSTYTQGHSDAVISSHARRTVDNSARFVLPHLKPNFSLLDVGCGPGSITSGFTQYLPQGRVVGVDLSEEVISKARSLNPSDKFPNLTFTTGNVLGGLPKSEFPDGSFDAAYTHQCVVHLPDPVAGIREIYRVLKPGGFLAMRETDMLVWYPHLPGLKLFDKALQEMVTAQGSPGFYQARKLQVWAKEAGFDRQKMVLGAGTNVYATDEERRWFAETYKHRFDEGESTYENFLKMGYTKEDLASIVRDFEKWAEDEMGWMGHYHCEVICYK